MKGRTATINIQTRMPSYTIQSAGTPGAVNSGFNNSGVKDPPKANFEVGGENPLISIARTEDDGDPEYPDPSAAPMNQTFPIAPPGEANALPDIKLGSQGV